MGLRNVVEGENSVAEFPQEIGAEGDEGPEGELFFLVSTTCQQIRWSKESARKQIDLGR